MGEVREPCGQSLWRNLWARELSVHQVIHQGKRSRVDGQQSRLPTSQLPLNLIEGLWQEKDGATVHDEIVVYEVMVKNLDEGWWSSYRKKLEQRFRQDKLVIQAQEIRLL